MMETKTSTESSAYLDQKARNLFMVPSSNRKNETHPNYSQLSSRGHVWRFLTMVIS